MIDSARFVVRLATLSSVAVLASCGEPMIYRYTYIVLSETPGLEIVERAPAKLDNLISGPIIPVKYVLRRKQYSLRITVDPTSYVTGAVVELVDSFGLRLEPKAIRVTRPDRPGSCGAYDNIPPTANRFEFSWNICDGAIGPDETVISFDVITKDGDKFEEYLPFTVEKDGFYWIWESY
jgi:hypothetical protein